MRFTIYYEFGKRFWDLDRFSRLLHDRSIDMKHIYDRPNVNEAMLEINL